MQQSLLVPQLSPAFWHVPERASHFFCGAPVEGSQPTGARQAAEAGVSLEPQHSSSTEQLVPLLFQGDGTR